MSLSRWSQGVWTVAAREVASLFRLPVGWIVVALYAFLSAVVFVQYTLIPGAPATMRYFFAAAAWMMVPVAPAISMRLLSEEARTGTIEMLRTAPVSDFAVAVGKFLGAWLFLLITLAPTLVLPVTLALVSEPTPDPGPILAGYLVLVCFGGLCLGVGLVASALTSSQTLAFLGTLMAIVFAMMLTGPVAARMGPDVAERLRVFSVMDRVTELSKGVLDTSAVAFFLIAIAWSVVLAGGVLESRRLSRARPVAAALWVAFIAGTGACAVLLGVLTSDFRVRLDVTSTGAHRLSPRARQMAELVDAPTEIVFAIDRQRSDKRATDLVTDVLEAYERASDEITLRVIDLSSPKGAEQTDDLLRVLAARESDRAGRVLDTLRASVATMRATAGELETLARELDSVRDAIAPGDQGAQNNRAFFDQRSGLARVGARALTEQAEALESGLAPADTPAGLPPVDRLTPPALGAWRTQHDQLTDLADQAGAFAASSIVTPNVASLARVAAQHSERLRDAASVARDRLERLPRLDTLRVARALETGEALLVVGPPERGVAAVDLDALMPPTDVLERAGLSPAGYIGPRAQELVATAIGQLLFPDQPVVVFTHGGKPGELLGASELFTKVVGRLRERGVDCLEWAASEQPEPPDLRSLDPGGRRPVVYLVISADSTAGTGDGRMTGAQRSTQLAAAVRRLIDSGVPVLLSLNPSIFPTYGDTDPVAALAEPFGIHATTGVTLLRDKTGPGGRQAEPLTTLVPPGGEHPVASAVRGLRTVLPWGVPMELTKADNARSWPLLELTGDDAKAAWGESRWLRLWSTPANARQLLRDQPAFDANEDTKQDAWTLAAAGERTTRLGTSRMIVVGSNGWAVDGVVLGTEQLVDGRVTTRFPGNGTLLDASIAWLSGRDQLIAPGADARPVATVKPLNPTQLSTFRWVLLGVVPGIVLLAGAAVRGVGG